MKRIIFLLYFSFLTFSANNSVIGEKNFEHYTGQNDPSLKVNYRSGVYLFKDKAYEDRFPMDLIDQDIYFLKTYYQDYLKLSLQCDDNFYKENVDYIHYLYRLSAISTLYEYLRKIHISLYQLGELEAECSLDYDALFGECRPKSREMSGFLSRLDSHFIDVIDWGRYGFVPKNTKLNHFKSFHGDTFVKNILHRNKPIEQTLNTSCQRIKSHMTSFCSEEDKFYGLSRVPEITQFIQSQSIFKVVNEIGSGKECMQRFVSSYDEVENKSDFLFPLLQNPVDEKKKLFFYGALKEFEELGVSVLPAEEEAIENVEVKEAIKKAEPKVIAKKKVIKKKEVQVITKKEKTKVRTKKKLSALHLAVQEFLKKRTVVSVDLEQAKKEYLFPKKLIKKFNGPLKPFQTLKALKEMKKNDILGSIQTPFSYIFLRYMLDFDLHQGLFNLKSVLGQEFYIVDDIEKKKKPIKIRLTNNKKTNYQWKLEIVEATK